MSKFFKKLIDLLVGPDHGARAVISASEKIIHASNKITKSADQFGEMVSSLQSTLGPAPKTKKTTPKSRSGKK